MKWPARVDLMRWLLAIGLGLALAACGGGGGSNASSTVTSSAAGSVLSVPVPAGANAMAITVDAGPAGSGNNVNRLYASVTVCPPGSASCQTIDHVLVDTGSTGLRLLASALSHPAAFTPLLADGGLPLLNCVQFVDNTYAWGPVVSADVVLGGKTASGVPIQIMGEAAYGVSVGACNPGGGTELNTVSALGAKGVLGLGLFQQDCGSACLSNTGNGRYYTCKDASCVASAGTTAPLASQLTHPVVKFATDNNGFVVTLPSVATSGAAGANGVLVFGVNTESNNQFTPARCWRPIAWATSPRSWAVRP